MDIELNILHPW